LTDCEEFIDEKLKKTKFRPIAEELGMCDTHPFIFKDKKECEKRCP